MVRDLPANSLDEKRREAKGKAQKRKGTCNVGSSVSKMKRIDDGDSIGGSMKMIENVASGKEKTEGAGRIGSTEAILAAIADLDKSVRALDQKQINESESILTGLAKLDERLTAFDQALGQAVARFEEQVMNWSNALHSMVSLVSLVSDKVDVFTGAYCQCVSNRVPETELLAIVSAAEGMEQSRCSRTELLTDMEELSQLTNERTSEDVSVGTDQ